MNKKITALTVTALASFALLGCNSDSDNDTESSNVNTGDTLILGSVENYRELITLAHN